MKLAILGAGQLGGSIALALRDTGEAFDICAYDLNIAHAQQLQAKDIVDSVAGTPADAVKDADVIFLTSPLRTYKALATAIAPAIKHGAIVTDVGSVKASMAVVAPLLLKARLVPGHPIAGTEKSGPEAANGELFRGRPCILTPDEKTDAGAVSAIEQLWHLMGADVLQMPVEVHDQIYAQVSHLPHYIAFVSAQFLFRAGVRVEPTNETLQRYLRISRSNARMWTDVALENREALLSAFTTYMAVLTHLVTELRSGEPGTPVAEVILAKNLLPRILASSLVSSVTLYEQQSGMSLRPFAGAGMRDISAPAATAPDNDTKAISDSAGAVADMMEKVLRDFTALTSLIGAENEPGLFESVSAMVSDAQALVVAKN